MIELELTMPEETPASDFWSVRAYCDEACDRAIESWVGLDALVAICLDSRGMAFPRWHA